MASYSIKLRNRSGQTFSYILYQQTPAVADAGKPVWPLILVNVKVPNSGAAAITFRLPDPYYAYAMTIQPPSHGNSVETDVKRAVTLGKKQQDGTFTPGSTVQYVVNDGVPNLADGTLPKNGVEKSFEIRTGSDFTEEDAKKGNFLIGYGSADKAYQGFPPVPNTSYQISPSNVYYLNFVDEIDGPIINPEVIGNDPLRLDFSLLGSSVGVTHNPDGRLVLEK